MDFLLIVLVSLKLMLKLSVEGEDFDNFYS
jgi:hypothetical protein